MFVHYSLQCNLDIDPDTFYQTIFSLQILIDLDRLVYLDYKAGLQCRGGCQCDEGPEGARHHCGGYG